MKIPHTNAMPPQDTPARETVAVAAIIGACAGYALGYEAARKVMTADPIDDTTDAVLLADGKVAGWE